MKKQDERVEVEGVEDERVDEEEIEDEMMKEQKMKEKEVRMSTEKGMLCRSNNKKPPSKTFQNTLFIKLPLYILYIRVC